MLFRSQQLTAIREQVLRLEHRQQRSLLALRDLLAETGILIADTDQLDEEQAKWAEEYFTTDILPLITPQAIDPSHPFPFVQTMGLGLIFRLKRGKRKADLMEMVLIPSGAPRFVRVPGDKAVYIAIEKLVTRFATLLFPGFKILGDGVFRVLRDSDIEVEEEAEDLVRYFRTAIQRRRRGRVIQLEIEEDFDPVAEQLLREQLGLSDAQVIKTNGLIGVEGLADIVDEDRPDLKFEPYSPRYPERIMEHDGDCFAAIGEKDIVIHHPYESFEVVVDFVRQAASDPDVVAIKQTLYRAGKQSAIINALIAAAEAGKSVTAVVELKARFDEEQNLLWANQLERAGVQVIYGFVDWKTHAKVSMVVRREGNRYRTYCHFGTGNYHPVTTRIYTDLSFFTADPRFGRDAAKLFNFVTGYVEPHGLEQLVVSPIDMRDELYRNIEREIANQQAGRPAAIWAKLNSLTDKGVIDKLYEAGQAGVQISLVVRGICCLKTGIPGISDTIEVKSIIGRFLEHSRIWAFANGYRLPSPRARVFITSADAMSRNLDRRVEAMVPIRNRTVHDQILQQVLLANLLDTEQSWILQTDGSYTRADSSDRPFNLHNYFMTNPSLSGRGQALVEDAVPRLALRKGAQV